MVGWSFSALRTLVHETDSKMRARSLYVVAAGHPYSTLVGAVLVEFGPGRSSDECGMEEE